jgi:hypothetical protein
VSFGKVQHAARSTPAYVSVGDITPAAVDAGLLEVARLGPFVG